MAIGIVQNYQTSKSKLSQFTDWLRPQAAPFSACCVLTSGSSPSPTSFIYSDNYNYGGTLNSRPIGNYWSSSVNSATNSYNLNFNTDGTTRNLNPQNNNNKGNAFAVRCVVQ